jgi:TM2 domain-containing membrane protein YozV
MIDCPHCNAKLENSPELAGQLVSCPSCGGHFQMPPIAPPQAVPFAFAATPQAASQQYRQESRAPGIAAVMSFVIPGAGQIFNGQIGKGIMMCCLYAVGWIFVVFLIGIPIVLGVWAWAIYDAYSVAENPPRKRRRY